MSERRTTTHVGVLAEGGVYRQTRAWRSVAGTRLNKRSRYHVARAQGQRTNI